MGNINIQETTLGQFSEGVTGAWEESGSRVASSFTLQRTGTTVAGFFKKPRLSPKPFTALSYLRISTRNCTGSFTAFSTYIRGVCGQAMPVPDTSSISVELLKAQMTQRFLLKCKNQKVNVAVFWAEWSQTAQMATRIITGIADAITYRLPRGDIGGAMRDLGLLPPGATYVSKRNKKRGRKPKKDAGFSDTSSDRWLEFQYGLKPLFDDMQGALESLADVGFRKELTHLTQKRKININDTKEYVSGRFLYRYASQAAVTYGITAYLKVRSDPRSDLARLGLTNPAAVIYEKIPYSFVLDWAYDVGGYISSWDAGLTVDWVSGGEYTVTEGFVTSTMLPAPGDTVTQGSAVGTSKSLQLSRTPLYSLPSPQLPPLKDVVMTSKHLANSIALLQGAYSRYHGGARR